MKQIYYCRHGECELNLQKVFAGRSDSPLTDLGREQAVLTGKDIIAKGIKIDKIVSLSLWRAYETAVILAREIGYLEEDIVTSDLLIERNFGMLEGTPRTEFFDSHSYQDIDFAPRAETIEQLHERAKAAVDFVESLPEENILVVSHSAFYRAFRRAIKKDPFSHEYTSPFSTIKNGKVYELGDIVTDDSLASAVTHSKQLISTEKI
jgi:probable phosphoglycerate mutase